MSRPSDSPTAQVEREFWIDHLTRKHECGEEDCTRIAWTLPGDGRVVHVWMPELSYEDDRLDLKASIRSDEFLTLVEPPLLTSVLKKCGQNRTAAARILGVQDRVGTLERGKDGDVAVFDGDPFEFTTHVCAVAIQGQVVSEGCH